MESKKIMLPVGKGRIYVYGSALKAMRGYPVSIDLEKIPGPCTDTSCQIITRLVFNKYRESQASTYVSLSAEGISLYISREVYNSIDRGRQNIKLVAAIGNRLSAKGFTYVM